MYNNRSNMQGNRRGGGGGGRYYNQNQHQRNHNRPNNNQGNRFQGNNNQVKNEQGKPSPSKPTPSSVKNSVTPTKPEKKEMKKQIQTPPPKPVSMPANAPQNKQFQPPLQQNQENDGVRPSEKKFTQRSRLFVGNLPINTSDDQFKDLFKKYGEISETFVNSAKGFGFVRLDTRANAEKAKWELDGIQIKNRQLRVRFASHGAALSIKHLSHFVSNELLEGAFSQFGPVERAVVIVDDRGKPTGRGIVEFARKSSATKALQQISEGCFLLTSSPQAIVVKPLEQEDTEDGQNEKNILRNQQYFQEREAPPRFAQPGTFEHKFALRWKALDEMERQQQEQLDKSIHSAREKLEREMDNAIHDHQTSMMKEDLRRRQEELDRLEQQRQREVDRRKQMEFVREDQHKKELEALAKRQEILRQQVEGNFQMQGMPPSERNLNPPSRSGGPGPGFGNAMMQDALALEMMVGGGQGGGLGPAPIPEPHSAKYCPLNASNMKKIIGDSKLIRNEEKYFRIMSQHTNTTETKECLRKDSSSPETFYSLRSHCPNVNDCQTLNQWKFQMRTSKINRMFARWSLRAPELILYFVPIGPFPEFIHEFKDQSSNRNLFQLMGDFLKSFFPGSMMRYLPEINIDDIPTQCRNHKLTGKKQYHVSGLLTFLQKQLPADGFAMIGLSWNDMYPCENLNFILGQGSSQHSACISSFGRFDPNYLKGFKGREDGISPDEMKDVTSVNNDVLWKLMKVLSHETCHVFGISHCKVFQCSMNESLSTEEALCQPMYLCPLCMSKILHLQTMLRTSETGQITVKDHFLSLLQFIESTFCVEDKVNETANKRFTETITWLKKMVEHLE